MNIDVVLASQNPDELCALVLKLFVNQEPQTQRSQTLAGYIQQREEALKNARQWRFGRKGEAFQGEQRGLFDEDIEQQLVTLLPEPKHQNICDPGKGKTPRGYLWLYIAAQGAERAIVLYDCQPGAVVSMPAMCLRAGTLPWWWTVMLAYQVLFGKRPGG